MLYELPTDVLAAALQRLARPATNGNPVKLIVTNAAEYAGRKAIGKNDAQR
jgi:hypothetical protein